MPDTLISRSAYENDARSVAASLLGQVLMSTVGGRRVGCIITEVEAYLGPEDPGSRASMHRRGRIVERLRGPPGVTLVYGVHGHWMLNIVAHPPGGWGAVLIRSCKPLTPIKPVPVGPGRLTRALGISREHDGVPVYDPSSPVRVIRGPGARRIARSHRIGIRRDLEEPLRYCIEGSRFISVKC